MLTISLDDDDDDDDDDDERMNFKLSSGLKSQTTDIYHSIFLFL